MVQFYFLAVCLNIIGGLILSEEYFSDRIPFLTSLKEFVTGKQSGKVAFALLAAATGVFKILSVTKGDVPVVGDLLPALSLFILGFSFGVEFLAERSTLAESTVNKLKDSLDKNSQIAGVGAVVIGIIHFVFPSVLFL